MASVDSKTPEGAAAAGAPGASEKKTYDVTSLPQWLVSGTPKELVYERAADHEEEVSNTYKNSWCQPRANTVEIRGADYLEDGVKVASAHPPGFHIVGTNCFEFEDTVPDMYNTIPSLKAYVDSHPDVEFMIVTWIVPGVPNRNVVHLLAKQIAPEEDPAFETAWKRFRYGTDEDRVSMFKFICFFQHGPWLVTKTVSALGGLRPGIIGRRLTLQQSSGANYLEIDIDISSSKVACAVCDAVLGSTASIVCDLVFVLEGQNSEELPERVAMIFRCFNCEFKAVSHPDPTSC